MKCMSASDAVREKYQCKSVWLCRVRRVKRRTNYPESSEYISRISDHICDADSWQIERATSAYVFLSATGTSYLSRVFLTLKMLFPARGSRCSGGVLRKLASGFKGAWYASQIDLPDGCRGAI